MNYSLIIKRSIEYIEKNLLEDIKARDVAKVTGYSLFHFSRIFQHCVGVSIGEYIRIRRLSLSRGEIVEGQKIIDTAFKYGFQTHSGFSKSFKREYGVSPKQLLKDIDMFYDNKYELNPLIRVGVVKKPVLKVAGFGIETKIASDELSKNMRIFWNEYETKGWECRLYEELSPPKHGEIGICIPSSVYEDKALYLFGVVVDNFNKVTDEMICYDIPASKYLVVTTPPIKTSVKDTSSRERFARSIKETWQYIYGYVLNNDKYNLDITKYPFEYYDERCHFRKDTVMDIYLPITD